MEFSCTDQSIRNPAQTAVTKAARRKLPRVCRSQWRRNSFCVPYPCVKLSHIKAQATTTLHPQRVENDTCTLMLFTNLAEPEWISINCSSRLLVTLACAHTVQNWHQVQTRRNFNEHNSTLICSPLDLAILAKCFSFQWKNASFTDASSTWLSQNFCKATEWGGIKNFTFLLEATLSTFPPIFFPHMSYHTLFNRYVSHRQLDLYQYSRAVVQISKAEGFVVCETHKMQVRKGENMFRCRTGQFASSLLVSDSETDCPNNHSEEIPHVQQDFGAKCSPLHFMTIHGSCMRFLPLGTDKHVESGPLIRRAKSCGQKHQLHCKPNSSQCFSVHNVCVYELNDNYQSTPCANGGHLENCKTYLCDTYFKCYDSYCTPWSHVCDGKWDCPAGEDEVFEHVCNHSQPCTQMFVCQKATRKCLHLVNVCDGIANCPLGDDEALCELKSVVCPLICHCLALAIACDHTTATFFTIIYPMVSVSLSFMQNFDLEEFLTFFNVTRFFHLSNNEIKHICFFTFPTDIIYLDVRHNFVLSLKRKCLDSYSHLAMFMVDNNEIDFVAEMSFNGLTNLQFLGISNNPLSELPELFIIGLPHLLIFLMNNLTLAQIQNGMFDKVPVKVIGTIDHHVCCISPSNSTCTARGPWYTPCHEHLLVTNHFFLSFLCVSVIVFLANTTSVFVQIMTRSKKDTFAVIAIFIHISDILFGFYLSIMWSNNIMYKNTFVTKEHLWRSSFICFLACGIVLWFAILSQLLLLFLSVTRLMVVINPIDTKFKRTRFTLVCMSWLFSLVFFASFVNICVLKITQKSLPVSLCLPFVNPENYVILSQTVTWLVAVCQVFTSSSSALVHCVIVKQFWISQQTIKKSKKNSGLFLVMQLFTITLSNVLCCFPTNVVYLAAMFHKFSSEIFLVTNAGIVPINPLVIPSIFVLVAVRRLLKFEVKQEGCV